MFHRFKWRILDFCQFFWTKIWTRDDLLTTENYANFKFITRPFHKQLIFSDFPVVKDIHSLANHAKIDDCVSYYFLVCIHLFYIKWYKIKVRFRNEKFFGILNHEDRDIIFQKTPYIILSVKSRGSGRNHKFLNKFSDFGIFRNLRIFYTLGFF